MFLRTEEDNNIWFLGKIKCNYKNGVLDGEYLIYFKEGELHKKCYYKDGELHGEYISYILNGCLNTKTYFLNGKVNGLMTEYNSFTGEYTISNYVIGTIKSKYYYKNDEFKDLIKEKYYL